MPSPAASRGLGARTLDGLAHPAPITEPARIADAVRDALATPISPSLAAVEPRP